MQKNSFELFMERTDDRLERMDERLDNLLEFKAMVLGGSIVVSVICSSIIAAAGIYFGVH